MLSILGALFLCSFPVAADERSGVIPAKELASLKKELESEGGMLLDLNDGTMYASYANHWSVYCTEQPRAVIVPASVEGLKSAILLLVKYGGEFVATVSRINQDCLSATTEYLINMGLFRTMEMDELNMRATFEAGTLIDEASVFALNYSEDYNVGAIVGVFGSVIGPIFGGGMQWYNNFAFPGTMADNTLEIHIMDHEGTVRVANSTTNTDLYWALRGGGGQLGVVTKVVVNVQKYDGLLSSGAYSIPCENSCTSNDFEKLLLKVGNCMSKLGDDVGVWAHTGVLAGGGALLWTTCGNCDLDTLFEPCLLNGVFLELPTEYREGTAKDANSFVRTLAVQYIGGPSHSPFDPITLNETLERWPANGVSLSGWFLKEWHPDVVKKVYREVKKVDRDNKCVPALYHFGGALRNRVDSAGSALKGAGFGFAIVCFANGKYKAHKTVNKYMANVPGVQASYWNYKNHYTPEEWAFPQTIKRIREIRAIYDPQKVFALPARKNNGTSFIERCFPPYDCSGNGQLAEGSKDRIPEDGCECICDDGFTGAKCEIPPK